MAEQNKGLLQAWDQRRAHRSNQTMYIGDRGIPQPALPTREFYRIQLQIFRQQLGPFTEDLRTAARVGKTEESQRGVLPRLEDLYPVIGAAHSHNPSADPGLRLNGRISTHTF